MREEKVKMNSRPLIVKNLITLYEFRPEPQLHVPSITRTILIGCYDAFIEASKAQRRAEKKHPESTYHFVEYIPRLIEDR